MFYNTINLNSDELIKARLKAKSQEDFIKVVFNLNKDLKVTPSQMHKIVNNSSIPITSIRRAMTNLSNENFLEKTYEKQIGLYGKKEHMWKVKTVNNNSNKFFKI